MRTTLSFGRCVFDGTLGSLTNGSVAMRACLLASLLLAMTLANGCSRSDDFGAFFVKEVTRCGGRIDTNASLPKLEARWTVKANENGFAAYVSGVPWSAVDAVIQQAIGKDKAYTMPGRVYGAAKPGVGVTLHWIFLDGRTEIICTRGESTL